MDQSAQQRLGWPRHLASPPWPPRSEAELLVTGPADGPVLTFSGDLDQSGANAVQAVLTAALSAQPGRTIVDLGAVSFMDSSGLALLVLIRNEIAVVELRNVAPAPLRLLELTGLSSKFQLP